MENFIGLIGIFILLGIAFLLSDNRKKIDYGIVIKGFALQIIFAIVILKTPIGKPFFNFFDVLIKKLLSFADKGGDFLFTSFVTGQVEAPLINFAIRVLPTIVFFSALMSLLYHLGVMQFIIKYISSFVQKVLKTSGSETLSVVGSIFVGQTEAPLLVKPFVKNMTKSELMTVMVGGFATISGGVMAIYVKMLDDIPGIAGHLMAASIMSAPAAIVFAKILYPETISNAEKNEIILEKPNSESNSLEVIADGSIEGLKLAANIAAMLIAIIGMVALVDGLLSMINLSLSEIFGFLFKPLAFTMGIPWEESGVFGTLLGEKIVLTELIAYKDLSVLLSTGQISPRSAKIASYALCGFANFASIGIQIGGLAGIAPNQKKNISKLALKAMIGGALASWMTACIAGIIM